MIYMIFRPKKVVCGLWSTNKFERAGSAMKCGFKICEQAQGKEPPGFGTYQTLAGVDLVC